ncbi:MAG TPA: hypothetical protein V6D07_14645 [Trichocoleus sp.]
MSRASTALASLPSQAQPQINLLPKDPLEAKFCQLFSYPWSWIKSEGNGWKTITKYPLQPRDLIRYWKDPHTFVGVSFDTDTAYGLIDLDVGGDYHPLSSPMALKGIKAALEDIGITRSLLLQSSESQGVWLLFPLPTAVSSFRLAQVLHGVLRKAGFNIRPGHLEVFPNLKHWDAAYHAHRLPLQAGSYLLDDDLQPFSDDLEVFLKAWEGAAAGQDIDTLKAAFGSYESVKPTSRESERARAFREDLQSRINEGWTGDAQTNDLLLDIGRLCRVFHRLGGSLLAKKISSMAQSLPGYKEHCDHQHEIERRAKDVARWAEKHYQPIGYGQAITEPMAARGPNNQDKAKDAQERIKAAVTALEATADPPTTVTEWRDEIAARGISPHTLYKYKYLWHPGHRIKAVPVSIPSKQNELSSLASEDQPAFPTMPDPLENEESIDLVHKKCLLFEGALLKPSVATPGSLCADLKLELLSEKTELPCKQDRALAPRFKRGDRVRVLQDGTQLWYVGKEFTIVRRVIEHGYTFYLLNAKLGPYALRVLPQFLELVLEASAKSRLSQPPEAIEPESVLVTSQQLDAVLGCDRNPFHGGGRWKVTIADFGKKVFDRLRQLVEKERLCSS